MRTGKYAKYVANKANGLVDITLFSLTPNSFITLFIFNIYRKAVFKDV